MSSQPQTYTPAQYLDAGFRAEMDGDRDRAAQYYVYVAEAFPDTPEGEAARGGLVRLGLGARGATGSAGSHEQQHSHPGHGHVSNGAFPSRHEPQASRAVPASSTRAPSHTSHPTQTQAASAQRIRLGDLAHLETTRPSQMNLQHGEPHGRASAATQAGHDMSGASHDPQTHEPLRLPEVVARHAREMAHGDSALLHLPQRYRGARLLARVISWLGWFIVLAGVVLLGIGVMGLSGAASGSIFGIAGSVMLGVGSIATGCLMALGGRVALAIFDQSDHLREVVTLLRTREGG